MQEFLTISKLNEKLGQVLSDSFKMPIWVAAEINSISINRSGH
ncbi:MAG: exodeoxyribonuclease VII large subunit [Bacteroidales bacterium]|jgi:exonuclease VII large subunit|nr:exodeoxyribonuclease VII large subunit [Bacteroidales bacterium]